MPSAKALAWIERGAWIAIYAGCFAIVLGFVWGGVHLVAGWSLGVLGSIAVGGGIALIIVRSRISETPASGAQSSQPSQGHP